MSGSHRLRPVDHTAVDPGSYRLRLEDHCGTHLVSGSHRLRPADYTAVDPGSHRLRPSGLFQMIVLESDFELFPQLCYILHNWLYR